MVGWKSLILRCLSILSRNEICGKFAMLEFVIREAVAEDCEDVLQLIKNLAVYEKEPESVVVTTPEVLLQDCFGENPWFYCYVAEQESNHKKELVGFALYHHAYSTWKGRMLYLEDLYVVPSARKKGIGIGFMKKLAKVASEKKCCKIKWSVLDWNQNSIDFFHSIGADIEKDWKLVCLGNSAMLTLAGNS